MYVLDTNVISALRIPERNPEVSRWAASVPTPHLYVAALSIAEIERGIMARAKKDGAAADVLRQWFERQVIPAFADRVLPFDLEAARVFSRYPVPQDAPYDDALIAATAEARGMTLVTRNVRHVEPLGVRFLNPWSAT